jgi:hypothetical protein
MSQVQAHAQRSLKSVSMLWDQESTNQSIILVLPDALRPKYYLPDREGKRQRDLAHAEREMARYEFLSRKSVSGSGIGNKSTRRHQKPYSIKLSFAPTNKRQLKVERSVYLLLFINLYSYIHIYICTICRRDLDEKYLIPLRADEKRRENFINKVAHLKESKNRNQNQIFTEVLR